MNLLPAKLERVWLVDAAGTAVEHKPQTKLTSGQRHQLYRLGLTVVDRLLREHGFHSNIETSSCILSYSLKNVIVDLKLMSSDDLGRFAHVTSHAGYEYTSKKVTATVTKARDMIGEKHAIKLSVSDLSGTRKPVFIPIPDDTVEPARFVVQNTLRTLVQMLESLPGFKFDKLRETAASTDRIPIDESCQSPAALLR